jgi:hypothetical protein
LRARAIVTPAMRCDAKKNAPAGERSLEPAKRVAVAQTEGQLSERKGATTTRRESYGSDFRPRARCWPKEWSADNNTYRVKGRFSLPPFMRATLIFELKTQIKERTLRCRIFHTFKARFLLGGWHKYISHFFLFFFFVLWTATK